MQIELWGATSLPSLLLPYRPLGYVLLILYAALLAAALFYYRSLLRQLSGRQWMLTLGLALLALVTRQFLPISYLSEGQLPPLAAAQNPASIAAPLAFIPILLAGAILGPPAAILVGLVDGLGRALWQSHQLLDPFHVALMAGLAAILMHQTYSGGLYAALRKPFVAGPMGAALMFLLTGLATYAYAASEASLLAALDLATSTSLAYIPGLAAESLIGGLLVWLIITNLPSPLPTRPSVSAPFSHSLNKRLMAAFLLFGLLLLAVLGVVGFVVATSVSTRLAAVQMAQDAGAVSAQIPRFLDRRQSTLVQAAGDERLLQEDEVELADALERLYRFSGYFKRVILVDAPEGVLASYPADAGSSRLTRVEVEGVTRTLRNGAPFVTPAQSSAEVAYVISVGVPVLDEAREPAAVLIGRVPNLGLEELVAGLQGTMGEGVGFIVDERGQTIGHPDSANLLTPWLPPDRGQSAIGLGEDLPGTVYRGFEGSLNTRELVYYQQGPGHPWTVVIRVPYDVVLGQSAGIAASLVGILLVGLALLAIYLVLLGRAVTQPLTELDRVSQEIAGGNLGATITPAGQDEIGRLGNSFRQMQSALKTRLDELSLLLAVTQEVSQTVDLNRSMPAILRGALRGTGAAGARVVIYSPTGRQPLVYGEGPASKIMARYDRQVTNLVKEQGETTLEDPHSVGLALTPSREPERVPNALLALPLMAQERVQGVFWITHRQPHRFNQNELDFLRTLAGQASVLVDNAGLYAAAEGGRRRLAAVLNSTSNAVLVTDQTDHIVLVNLAMSRLLGSAEDALIGRNVRGVIHNQALMSALTSGAAPGANLELTGQDDTVYYGGVSSVLNHDGQPFGRVAVFKDITYLKEIDKMKSEFVANVSHDLRSPLTYMLGYASTLPVVGTLDPQQQAYVDKIIEGIDQMTRLIDALLDLGRLEAGIALVVTEVHLAEVIKSVTHELRQPALDSGCQITLQLQPSLPPLRGDLNHIRQAIFNYVSNAIKYAPGSGPITVAARRQEYELVVSVEDRGPGLSSQDQHMVFEKFYRANKEDHEKRVVRGSGLGLALVKSVAERHGGRAWCESTLGQGSTFYFTLPLAGPD